MELLNTILPDHKPGESKLWDAIGMAAEALKAWEPEADCEACKVDYND